jgi:hypothetical protein
VIGYIDVEFFSGLMGTKRSRAIQSGPEVIQILEGNPFGVS